VTEATDTVAASRRRLLLDTLGIAVAGVPFGLIYGVAARGVGYTPLDAGLTSLFVFAGGAQFAAAAALGAGASWGTVVLITAFINGRHLFYGAVLAPYVADLPRLTRAAMAHVLDDETFALSINHFRRIGRRDLRAYAIAALLGTFVPWIGATFVGAAVGAQIPDPAKFGLDVSYPAAMGGLAIVLARARSEVAAAVIAAISAVAVALATNATIGIVGGALLGSIVAFALPDDELMGDPAATGLP
jgi:4-azaleucine resistance transporter AzlC